MSAPCRLPHLSRILWSHTFCDLPLNLFFLETDVIDTFDNKFASPFTIA